MVKSSENPLVDIGKNTISAFNVINSKNKKQSVILGKNDTLKNTPNKSAYVYVYTPQDKQKHSYFHSLTIDKEVEDFMGTAELKCPFDSDLMEYWEPIRNYCIIYGSNKGMANAKILFIGRVRGVKQEGYELVIQFQDPYWKFKQLVTQSYANDNVINKDGYTIMRLLLEALKFDSYVISESAKSRLEQVGFDKDGNVTLNKKKIEEMPDLIKRLKKSDPSKFVNKETIVNKLMESKAGNIKNINYTLKYEKPTPVMKKIASEGSANGGFEAGKSMYGTNYGAKASSTGTGVGGSNSGNAPNAPENLCDFIKSSTIRQHMKEIWSYNRGYISNVDGAKQAILNYANNYPSAFQSQAVPCLRTLAKRPRDDGTNVAQDLINSGNGASESAKRVGNAVNTAANVINTAGNAWNQVGKAIGNGLNQAGKAIGGGLNQAGKAIGNAWNSLWS